MGSSPASASATRRGTARARRRSAARAPRPATAEARRRGAATAGRCPGRARTRRASTARLADRRARRADELGVEREHRSDAVHDPRHPEPVGHQRSRGFQHLVDDEVGAPLLGHLEQIVEPRQRRGAEECHHAAHHLLFLGQVRVRPYRLVRGPSFFERRPDGVDIQPASGQRATRSGPVATRTSWPARSAARISGSIGRTCPYAGPR